MNFAALRSAALITLLAIAGVWPAAAQALQVDVEEFRRLAGEVADLRDANLAHMRKIAQMQKEIDVLRDALRDANERSTTKMADFTTREDLKKVAEKIQEVDQRREADRKLILEEFEKLAKTLAAPPVERPDRRGSRKQKEKEPEKESTNDPAPQPFEGTVYPYKVQEGERLSDIIKVYNEALKKEGRPGIGLDAVKRANPKININRIYVGQEILLPVPDKKK